LQEESTGILNWLKEAKMNTIVLDRGFRNVIEELEKLDNVQAKMPSCNAKGNKQQSVYDANQSRLVTKVRWTVEAYHGRLKKWKFFYNRQPTAHIQSLNQFLRVTTAALNALRPVLYDTTTDYEYHISVAREMLKKSEEKTNPVSERVAKGTLSSRGGWKVQLDQVDDGAGDEFPMDKEGTLPDFPVLNEDEITEKITCGNYQIKQAKHYADEHLEENGGFTYFVHKSAPDLIRLRLQSRHKNAKQYYVWVQYDPKTPINSGSITGWHCQCKAGARTVGCCAHVATAIWYLGYARHQNYKMSPNIYNYWRGVINSNGIAKFKNSDEEDEDEDEEAAKK
jgi:hypothetical protein